MEEKKIALVVYPEFSIQEIANLSALFRWYYNSKTVVFSSNKDPVSSEEGFVLLPEKTLDEFSKDAYHCLILSGCSDFRLALEEQKLHEFLCRFQGEKEFVIGAICAAPLFLARAGLLKGKKFTNSLYVQMNERFSFIENHNRVYAPLVVSDNIITAVGDAFQPFAVEVARRVGLDCPNNAYGGLNTDWTEDDFKFYLDEEGIKMMEDAYGKYFDEKC